MPKKQQHKLILPFLVLAFAVMIGFGVAYGLGKMQRVEAASCPEKDVCVSLLENKTDPDTIAVPRGSYVQFNSADGKSHSLSLGKGGESHSHSGSFSSGEFGADEAWRVQFNDEGTFFFHDHFNPKINVLVVVYTPGKEYKIQ